MEKFQDFPPQRNQQESTPATRFKEKIEKWENLIRGITVRGWTLKNTSTNYRKGASLYAFFERITSQGKIIEVKVRLSDHAGRWSGYDLDLRDPKEKDLDKIIKCLEARTRQHG